ncbi:MAG: thiamine biosynthesis protein ThiS [Candidatus Melainabacteria bacterium GWF2_37_15]|nr:MAG: thiamine biosynthesis protein ThiS [Candidatus Melainabacteria bacterium GWF2_37_15]
MKVIINGIETEIPENSTIKQVLNLVNIKSNMLVVEKNLCIIDKKDYESHLLKDGDSLEIVGFFGGG